MGVLLKQDVSVRCKNDTVVLGIGKYDMPFGIDTTFNMAQGLRLASNHLLAAGGVPRSERRNIKRDAFLDQDVPGVSVKRSPVELSGKPWRIDIVPPLVHLCVADLVFELEPDVAAIIAGWMRSRGKEAKRWSGIRTSSFRAQGILSDAEENYRLGIK